MSDQESKRQFQDDFDQYWMDNVIRTPKNYVYQVGYEASSGNPTGDHQEAKKRVNGRTAEPEKNVLSVFAFWMES
ncbi:MULTISPECIES: hypothetical protein [Geobacillus]|uniref:Uncharacterized protein n=1 Tax=Geobacillus thermodenitrificans TaxID=33940 RepID=A0ABY9QGT4_GEOTD|nr:MULTISPECIES: hypothetical protein [Geobacillus]MED3906096.1 hypothetical protein [Geobacillus thermodenitrificans]QNU33130.1 hypothetical protein IC804_17925 [Geobacillus sp. 47C-IIb]WMV77791.1 hypothetical protein HSX42_08650 [Geobacillus thermodenitrificans]